MCPYLEHPEIKVIKDNLSIWRFMNFDKFLSLIQTKSLYFSSAEIIAKKFDPWEGILPQETIDATYEYFKHNPREIVAKNADNMIQHIKDLKNLRNRIHLNCWHVNDIEQNICGILARARKVFQTCQADTSNMGYTVHVVLDL